MAGVERLENHRITDFLDDVHCALYRARDVAGWYRETDIAEHSLGVVLVLRYLDGDRAGVVGERGLDAPQIFAEPELYERVVIETAHGDAASFGFFDQRRRRRAQSHRFVKGEELLGDFAHIDLGVGNGGANDLHRVAHALEADFFFLVGDDHPPSVGIT